MQQVKIYIETDSSSPKATEKHYGYVLERNLAIWAGNEFLTSKRKPVANQQEWMEIWRLSNRHLILTEPGKHEYTGWLQGEIEKRKRDNDGIQDHDHEISADVSKNDKKAVR